MCDERPIWTWFGLINGAIAGAMATALVAIATNPTWWTSWLSAVLLGVAAGTAGAAAGLVFAVQKAMNDYYRCMAGTSTLCENERSTADKILVSIGATIGTAASIALFNLVVALVPFAGQIPMWAFYIALAAQLGLLPAAGVALAGMIDCLKKSKLGKNKTSLVSTSGKLDYDVFTCPLNRSTCSDSDLQRAGRSVTPVFSVAPSFAVLLKSTTSNTVASVLAAVTDGYGNRAAIDATEVSPPATHAISDPSYFAVRYQWATLSQRGIRLEPANREWAAHLEATFKDGSKDTLDVKVLVSS